MLSGMFSKPENAKLYCPKFPEAILKFPSGHSVETSLPEEEDALFVNHTEILKAEVF